MVYCYYQKLRYSKIKNKKMETMKKLSKKLADHGRRHVHYSIFIPVVAIAMLGLVDWPLFSLAEELSMQIPIVHVYKVSQNEAGTSATAVNAPASTTETETISVPVPETTTAPVLTPPSRNLDVT